MTKEEYLALTNIESEEEALQLLQNVRRAFVAMMLVQFLPLTIVLSGLLPLEVYQGPLAYVPSALFVLLAGYFWYVIKREKISKANFWFGILFSPISWFWFYRELTDPLKIILGEKEPPKEVKKPDVAASKKRLRKSYLHAVLIGFAVCFMVVIVAILSEV